MKGNILIKFIIPLLLVVVILGYAGANLVPGSFIAPEEMISGCTAKEGTMLVPLFGYYKCESEGYKQIDTVDLKTCCLLQETVFMCDYMTESCTIQLQKDNGQLGPTWVVPRGDIFTIKNYGSYDWGYTKALVFGTPHRLINYNPGGGFNVVSSQNCRLPTSEGLGFVSSIENLLNKDGVFTYGGVIKDELGFGEHSNYLDKFVFGPDEFNLVTYQGQDAYCSGNGNIYSLGTIQLELGSCYKVPGSYQAKVTCCPDAVFGTQTCSDDFKWIDSSQSGCQIDMNCPGQGTWVVDTTDPSRITSMKYTCVSGECIKETKISECAGAVCPVGEVCDFDTNTGIGTCVEGGSSGVNPPPQPITGINWLKNFLVSFFASLFILGGTIILSWIPLPFFKIFKVPAKYLINFKLFVIAMLILTLLFMFMFYGIATAISGAIVGAFIV